MPQAMEVTKGLAIEELKSLVDVQGPCLTMFLPIEKAPNTTQVEEIRSKSLIQTAERDLTEQGADTATIRDLLGPLPTIPADRDNWGIIPGGTLVVLRSKDIFRAFEIGRALPEGVQVGPRFQVLPFFRALREDKLEFYLLSLSQKHVRLLRCTPFESAEIPLPKGIPGNLEEWLNTYQPSSANPHADPRPSDAGPAGSFTSTHDRDRKDEFIQNYFRVINKGLTDMLQDESVPMVLCGTDDEQAMYRSVNTYETLVEEGVQGSPESLKGGEMHRRALEIAREHAQQPFLKARELFGTWGVERMSTHAPEIMKAIHMSRVAYLFASEDGTLRGRYDESSMELRSDGKQEDLINFAVLKTLAFGGEVFVTDRANIPEQALMAAIFRF